MFNDVICIRCIHFRADNKEINTCAAYEEEENPRIPWEIWSGENDHSKPFKQTKNKLVFTEIK